MSVIDRPIDTGTAYGRKAGVSNRELMEVAQGTKMGEFLRRYWQPVGLSTDATDTPRQVRILGEDLILFRDKTGRAGLVYSRCAHRGTTLYYGKVEERGIRCCYHGWLFDVEGRCLEQPCEPELGKQHRDKVRQPWYPVQERYGLVFAYMGPPEKKPALPRFDIVEELEADEYIEPDGTSLGSGGGVIIPCSWTHHMDNVPDTFHVPILHGSHSGGQFVDQMAIMPQVDWAYTENGMKTVSRRKRPDGKTLMRVTEGLMPNIRVIPDPRIPDSERCDGIGWLLPIDETNYRIYSVFRKKKDRQLRDRAHPGGKNWFELSEEEHQKYPDDYEAQVGQGANTLHSEEHLATTDRGVVMMRRLLQKQMDSVAAGQDPIGLSFDENAPPVRLEAGNFIVDS